MFDEPIIEISTREVSAVTPDTSIAKAIGIMEKNNFHNLVVLDSDVIYLVTIQDLLLASNPESYVEGVMFKPHCIDKDTQTIDAICEMVDSGQSAAPVVAGDGTLVGIVTDYDIMKRGAESLTLKDTNGRFTVQIRIALSKMEYQIHVSITIHVFFMPPRLAALFVDMCFACAFKSYCGVIYKSCIKTIIT